MYFAKKAAAALLCISTLAFSGGCFLLAALSAGKRGRRESLRNRRFRMTSGRNRMEGESDSPKVPAIGRMVRSP